MLPPDSHEMTNGIQWAPASDRAMNHYQAEEYARNLSLAGGGWRLPTRAELKSLYDKSKPGGVDAKFHVGDYGTGLLMKKRYEVRAKNPAANKVECLRQAQLGVAQGSEHHP